MKAKYFDRTGFLARIWPEALESGEFKQGRTRLYSGPKNMSGEYSCLGVACELLSRMQLLPRKDWINCVCLPEKACALLGIDRHGWYHCVVADDSTLANDNYSGKSFNRIAAIIRKIAKNKRFIKPECRK